MAQNFQVARHQPIISIAGLSLETVPMLSLELLTQAPYHLANFLAVILDSEVHDGQRLTIGVTRFIFCQGDRPKSDVSFLFDGFTSSEIENCYQRANFYHFRESKKLSVELEFHLPRLQKADNVITLSWHDWDGRLWSFASANSVEIAGKN